jgi:hypothetical protein
MNHPDRETCRNCGFELTYIPNSSQRNSLTFQENVKKSNANKLIALFGLVLLLFLSSAYGLYVSGQIENYLPFLKSKETVTERDKEIKGKEIWEKHREMSGEKDKSAPQNLVMKAVVGIYREKIGTPKTNLDKPVVAGNSEYYFKMPGKIYSRLKLMLPRTRENPPMTVISERFFDGEKGWEKKTEFQTVPEISFERVEKNKTEKIEALTETDIDSLKEEIFNNLVSGYTSFKDIGTLEVEGKKHLSITAKKASGITDVIYLDPETYLVSKIDLELRPGSKQSEFGKEMMFSDYRMVNGVQFPFVTYSSGTMATLKMAFTEVMFDTEIDDNIFQMK